MVNPDGSKLLIFGWRSLNMGLRSLGLERQFADDSLKADREVVMTAVKNSGGALKHADDS